MALYLGLDLGTSVLKATIINEEGKIIGASAKEIHIHSPKSGWAEESPAAWWETFQDLIRGLKNAAPLKQIKAVGLSGQMHGIVCYDKNLKPMRPAIIWPDKRSAAQVEKILKKLPSSKIYAITGNPIFTGFMLPSLLWLKENENKLYKSLERVSSPKDFIALKLTDNLSCEPSDALATGCFNYIKNTWSDKIIKSMGLNKDLFPKIIPTSKPYGTITAATSKSTGLPAGIPVFGGSDQSMAAMGSGLISEGSSLLAISTGGQFLAVTKKTIIDPKGRLHTLKHAIDGLNIYMAATLAAGLSLKWFKTSIMQQLDSAYDTFIDGIDGIPIGSDGLIYLPFLAGERTPYFNSHLKGAFIGQSLNQNRLHFIRAIMEGVAFSFRDGLDTLKDSGIEIKNITLSGGGTKNATWRRIITDVLNIPTQMININDHSPFGAAAYAKFAVEGFRGLPAFYKKNIIPGHKLRPIPKNVAAYAKIYKQYKKHAEYLNNTFK